MDRSPKAVGAPPPEGLARLEFAHLLGDPSFKHAHALSHVEALPGGRVLSACEDGSARIWDLDTGNEVARFSHNFDKVWNAIASVAASAWGLLVALAHDLAAQLPTGFGALIELSTAPRLILGILVMLVFVGGFVLGLRRR